MPDDNLLTIAVYITGEIRIGHTHNMESKVGPITQSRTTLRMSAGT